MKNLLCITLLISSSIALAGSLNDFTGSYRLLNRRGDNGQFTPECTENLQVVLNSNNSLQGYFLKSSNSITSILFKNIGSGTVQGIGDKGVYKTVLSQNKLVETYTAESMFSSYSRVKMLELGNRTLRVSIKTSDREIDMECTYQK
jgi:hypothetical protein